MTNPDNIVRVRARNGGRASVYEANGWAQAYTAGLIEGHGVTQNTSADMNVLVGGSGSKPDVILAENPSGYKIALDLVGQQPIAITAPASNSRISAVVAYTDDLSLATTQDTVTGSPASCGLIVVNGTASVSPSEPSDAQIRTAITSDGATGSQAAYCVIATILVANDTTIITNSMITNNMSKVAGIGVIQAQNIDFTTIAAGNYSTSEVDTGFTWVDGKTIYKKTVNFGALPNNTVKKVLHNIANLDWVVKTDGYCKDSVGNRLFLPAPSTSPITLNVTDTEVFVTTSSDRSSYTEAYFTIYYTKSS